jgi:hypothetical protein
MINIRQNQPATPLAPLARDIPRQEAGESLPIAMLSLGLVAWSRITHHESLLALG